jgi:phage-related tail fiber protein
MQIALGDGNGAETVPDENATSLAREVYRANIISLSRYPSNNSVLIAECFIPAGIGGFYIREIGVYDDSNNLIAIGNYPEHYKEDGSGGIADECRINVMLSVGSKAVVQLVLDASMTLVTKSSMEAELAKKQDKLVAGNNIKIEGDTISATLKNNAADIQYNGEVEDATNASDAIDTLATSKQNNILVFETQAEYDAAAPTIPPKTFILKLF